MKTAKSKKSTTKTKAHLVFHCRNVQCCETCGEISIQNGNVFYNPYRHLCACIADGNDTILLDIYRNFMKQKDQGLDQRTLTQLVAKITPRSKAMNDYIKLGMKNLPFKFVKNATFWTLPKHSEHFARLTIRKTMIKLTEFLERKILVQLQSAEREAILHDGWPFGGVQYIVVFASYFLTK